MQHRAMALLVVAALSLSVPASSWRGVYAQGESRTFLETIETVVPDGRLTSDCPSTGSHGF
jgi:hypothetical protein